MATTTGPRPTSSQPQPQPQPPTSPTADILTNAPTNPRGIPLAPFVDKVEDYVSSRQEVEGTIKRFQEMISKYQFMEQSTSRRALGLREKVPDIEKTLGMVLYLQSRGEDADPLPTTFELSDTLFAHALVPRTEEVYLWLGANVMLSYAIPEAVSLLTEKRDGARRKLQECEEDVEFLREQITTLEVATARVYNWDVTMRRKEKEIDGGVVEGKT